jgi:iron-sulfur cluster assembly protein/iron-sulfur cluster insertion protein
MTNDTADVDTTSRLLTVEPAAATRVRQLLDSEGDPELALHVGVRPGGCSGFSYEMWFDRRDGSDGEVLVVTPPDGAPFDVVVDTTSAVLLAGATLTYSDSLERSGFKVDNPNAQRTCGCGQSFS